MEAWSTSPPKASSTVTLYKRPHPEKELSKKISPEEEPPRKRKKITTAVDRSPPTNLSFADLGGMDIVIQELGKLLIPPLRGPTRYARKRNRPPGILLHGPPGCGKTQTANAVAAVFGLPFITFSATSIVSGMSGESEKGLREVFEEARSLAPCLVFIDEIDAITQKREGAQGAMEKRIVAQLLTCMDDLSFEKTGGKAVVVMAATNRLDSLDPALRRPGRFGKEISMGIPNKAIREAILRTLTRKWTIAGDVDFGQLANQTTGFVGADLENLVDTAGSIADERFLDTLLTPSSVPIEPALSLAANSFLNRMQREQQMESLIAAGANPDATLNSADFASALTQIQPSLKREGFATIPTTTFSSIGALESTCEALKQEVVVPILNAEEHARRGLLPPTGVLLWGPPGCGKTLLAEAVANAAGASFICINGAEPLSKYVGDSEKAVRRIFDRARNAVPTVIFFDEIDALAPRRGQTGNDTSPRVVTTMLTEMDKLGKGSGVYVVAATNRPHALDPAMLRRLSVKFFVGLPGELQRAEILHTLMQNMNRQMRDLNQQAPYILSDGALDVIAWTARKCKGFSGADMSELLRKAHREAMRAEEWQGITVGHFIKAMEGMAPSVEMKDQQKYEHMKRRFA